MPGAVGATWQRSVKTAVGTLTVKRWSSGEMALRWTAAGMFEAERQFRRVIGYKQLAALALAVQRDMNRSSTPTEEVATLVPA